MPQPSLRARTPIKAILFDKDGTLFDFQGTWRSVFDQVLEAIAPDPETLLEMARSSGYDPVERRFKPGSVIVAGTTGEIAIHWARYCPGLTATEIERIANNAADALGDAGAGMTPAVPDLPTFLDTLRGEGYALGVATHDSESAARAQLEAWGAAAAFDFICGYDSGLGHKPGPGMLQAFAQHCALDPETVAMVGDSIHDLEMARNARAALAIGVLTGPAQATDLAHLAHHILPSIGALPALLRGEAI